MADLVHIAAQYLATVNINFLEKKEDDSHTNLGFSIESGSLSTHSLTDSGEFLSLNYTNFSLEWHGKNSSSVLELDGKTHQDVLNWINQRAKDFAMGKSYVYELHYDLPYEKITTDFTFQKPSQEELNRLLRLRIIAQGAIEKVVNDMNLDTSIRIWPHHFDTGGFVVLDSKNNTSVGFGMAIPDTMIDDFYLYTSGYKDHDGVDTSSFDELTLGNWKSQGFKGAVLPMNNVDEATAVTFFKESISKYNAL